VIVLPSGDIVASTSQPHVSPARTAFRVDFSSRWLEPSVFMIHTAS